MRPHGELFVKTAIRRYRDTRAAESQHALTRPSGAAFLWVLRALGCDGDDVLPICIGDHLTDEDAFRALVGRGISIVVLDEPRDRHAVYTLRDPDQVGAFLDALATSLADR